MTFDDYLTAVKENHELSIAASWGQGRTTFGGLSAALGLSRILNHADSGILRSVSVNFCGPLIMEQPFDISQQTLRSGKSVAHYQASVSQDDKLCTLVTACFGRDRESAIHVPYPQSETGSPDDGQRLPYIKGVVPEFTQHISFSYCDGGLPFTNSKQNLLRGWMRFNEGEGQLSEAHLIALIDAWPPTLLQKLRSPAPCATITWNVELVTPLSKLEPMKSTDWLWYEADIRQAHDGYGHTEARIMNADGTLLALSRQLVAVYDQ